MFTVGVFAILFDEQGRVLLCHRRDLDCWNLPGGGLESGELPTQAAVRETREETGLEVIVDRLVGVYAKTYEDELVFTFTGKIVAGELTTTDESDACRFIEIEVLPANTIPKHVERIRDALEMEPQPFFRHESGASAKDIFKNQGLDNRHR
jgi:8-oxo-dGTP diphosphatase